MPEKTAKRSYTQEEVDAILSRALSKQSKDENKYAHDDLVAAAMEVGISREAIEHAAEEQARPESADENEKDDLEDAKPASAKAATKEPEQDALVRAWKENARAKLVRACGTYAIIGTMLFLIARLSHSGHWYLWPWLSFGVLAAFQLLSFFGTSREKIIAQQQGKLDRIARKDARRAARDERDRLRHEKKMARERRKATFRNLGSAIETELDHAASDLLKVLEKRRIATVRDETESAKETMRARVAELDRQREEVDPSLDELEEHDESQDKRRKSR